MDIQDSIIAVLPMGAKTPTQLDRLPNELPKRTTGRVVDSTIRDVWPKDKPRLTGHELYQYTSFIRATASALRRTEFEPANIGGCRVKQLVEMPFVFALNP